MVIFDWRGKIAALIENPCFSFFIGRNDLHRLIMMKTGTLITKGK
jgi:hypothetical protein